MAKRGGFPGGMPGNMNNLMEAGTAYAAPDGRDNKGIRGKGIYSSSRRRSGNSNGFRQKEVVSIKLAEEVVDPDDIEMLQDLIVAATNEAFRQMEADSAEAMSRLTGGLGGALGGGFPF